MSQLLSPVQIAGLELKNRVVMPPMCMYEVEKEDGKVTPFHQAHYGARAIGQVGLIILEATAVEPDGRLTKHDLGLWEDEQLAGMKSLVDNLHSLGAKVGVQLCHAGRKAKDAIDRIAPGAIAYDDEYGVPRAMTLEDIKRVQDSFVAAAKRAEEAGFDLIELHGAHGYLINQFLEPLTNQRTDTYGGSLENRYRLVGELLPRLKEVFSGAIWVRLSMTAYDETGVENTLEDWQTIGSWLERDGADALDISTGGLLAVRPNIPIYGGYQAPFTAKMKEAVSIPCTAVGLINETALAEHLLQTGQADLIEVGRGLIRNVNWLADAAETLHDHDFKVYNNSYQRGQVR